MDYILKRIDALLRMKHVDRLSGTPTIQRYNLMEHQYIVAQLFRIFAAQEDVSYTVQELDIVLNHDILETETGDLLYTAKNLNSKVKEHWESIEQEIAEHYPYLLRYSDEFIKESLNERQHALFKCCDLLDLWLFIDSEENLGNRDKRLMVVKGRTTELIVQLAESNGFSRILKFIRQWTERN